MDRDMPGFVTAQQVKEFCHLHLKMSGGVLPAGPYYERKAVEDTWRYLTKRCGDIFSEFTERQGLGRGRGVETYYPEEFQRVILGAMQLRIKGAMKPMELDQWLTTELVNVGLLKHRYRVLFDLIYNRAVIDTLNLSENDPAAFKKELCRILLTRGKQVEFEWRTKAIRKQIRNDPSPDPKPTKADVNLLSMGLDYILQSGQPKQGMRWDMDIAEIESIIDDFHSQRLHVLDLFRRTLSGDAQSADTLEQMGVEVIDSMPSDWLVDSPDDSATDRTLRLRPENLMVYVLLRLTWMWREEKDSPRGRAESFMELLQSRFLSCPTCGRIELRFRQGDKNQCRVCRNMDGAVRLRKPRKR